MTVAASAILVAACRGESDSVEVPESAPTSTTTAGSHQPTISASVTSVPTTDGGQTLSPDATMHEIVAAAEAVLGPTDDVVATLSPFVSLPGNIRTPADAEIVDFGVHLSLVDGMPTVDATVSFVASGTAEHLTTYYETTLADAGYERNATGGASPVGADIVEQTVRYDLPAPPTGVGDADHRIEVRISSEAGAASPQPVHLDLRVVTTARDTDLERLTGWPGDVPGLGSSIAVDASVSTMALNLDMDAELRVSYRSTAPRSQLERSIRAHLPSDLYRAAPAEEPFPDVIPVTRDDVDQITFIVDRGQERGTSLLTVAADMTFNDRGGTAVEAGGPSQSPTMHGDGADHGSLPAPPISIPTPPKASPHADNGVNEIVADAHAVLGPTNDIVAALASFVELPGVIRSPTGTNIRDFAVNYQSPSLDADVTEPPIVDVTVYLTSSGRLDDVAEFYDTTLLAAGVERTARPTEFIDGDRTLRTLTYAIPRSDELDCVQCGIELHLNDGPNEGGWLATDWIELRVVDVAEQADLERLARWAGALPGVASPRITSATMSTSLTRNDASLSLGVTYSTPGRAKDLSSHIRRHLPDSPDGWAHLGGLNDAWITVYDGLTDGTADVRLSGTVDAVRDDW